MRAFPWHLFPDSGDVEEVQRPKVPDLAHGNLKTGIIISGCEPSVRMHDPVGRSWLLLSGQSSSSWWRRDNSSLLPLWKRRPEPEATGPGKGRVRLGPGPLFFPGPSWPFSPANLRGSQHPAGAGLKLGAPLAERLKQFSQASPGCGCVLD